MPSVENQTSTHNDATSAPAQTSTPQTNHLPAISIPNATDRQDESGSAPVTLPTGIRRQQKTNRPINTVQQSQVPALHTSQSPNQPLAELAVQPFPELARANHNTQHQPAPASIMTQSTQLTDRHQPAPAIIMTESSQLTDRQTISRGAETKNRRVRNADTLAVEEASQFGNLSKRKSRPRVRQS